MIITIPIEPGRPHIEQEVDLDGVSYRLALNWNGREGAWYMTLWTADGTLVRAGVKLVANFPLLRKVRHERRPPGELMAMDPRGTGITLDNLGLEIELAYVDAQSLAEAVSE